MQRAKKAEKGAARSAFGQKESRSGARNFWGPETEQQSQGELCGPLCRANLMDLPLHAKAEPNRTGMPDLLKAGIEALSGIDLSDVRVHANSDKPAQLNALAYAQGNQIHLGPEHSKHLPHEAWHLVQQKQGRVRPTGMISGMPLNDSQSLEQEADRFEVEAATNSVGQKINNITQSFGFVDNRPENEIQRKLQGQTVLQLMSFARFQGFRRMINWTYNSEENELLRLENKAQELLNGLNDYYSNSLKPTLPGEYIELKNRFAKVKDSTYSKNEYSVVKSNLESIIADGDNISSKLARTDLPLEEGFDLSQKEALDKAKIIINKETTLSQIMEIVKTIAQKQDLSDAVILRELTDIFVQFISDAIMKLKDDAGRPKAVQLKADLIDAATDIHTAYLFGSLKKDMKFAEIYYRLGTEKLSRFGASLTELFSNPSESTKGKAYPKYREESDKAFESGAIMLASAFIKDNFIPDMVVGLPTGGVHAAHRVVAAINIISGKKPLMWATRPQGVKEESKTFMEGTNPEDILNKQEKEYLMGKLSKESKINIAVVDDGFISGSTLQKTKKIYQELFQGSSTVDVRTGVIDAGYQQMNAEVAINIDTAELEKVPNPADYVVVPSLRVAGKTGELDKMVTEKVLGSRERWPQDKMVAILSNRNNLPELKLGDILDRL
jgi:hypothetical protein